MPSIVNTQTEAFESMSLSASVPLVSVCIPAFNAEKYVAEAVDSVLRQTYPHVEIICVDDGSSDATGSILSGYGSAIRLLSTDNRGAQRARNTALAEANGEFVHFLDADCFLMEKSIEAKVAKLIEGSADLAFSNQTVLHDSGDQTHPHSRPDPDGLDPFLYCMKYNVPGGTTAIDTNVALHRASTIRKVGGFRPGVVPCDDKDLALRLAAAGARLHYVDEELSVYRDHAGPRISTAPRRKGYPLNYFIDLLAALQASPVYALTLSRKAALRDVLVGLAKENFRAGNLEEAKAGFEAVRALGSNIGRYRGDSNSYRLLRSLIGYWHTESLRSALGRDQRRAELARK